MGLYIQTNSNFDKAKYLCENYNGKIVTKENAKELLNNKDLAIICVLDNIYFEAAGYCYDLDEFNAFNDPGDTRRKWWVVLKKDIAEKLTGIK